MNKRSLKVAGSLSALALVAACTTPLTDEDRMTATMAVGSLDDTQMMAGCSNSDLGRGGMLGHSKLHKAYVLSLSKGDTGTVTLTPEGEGIMDNLFAKLNDHCYKP